MTRPRPHPSPLAEPKLRTWVERSILLAVGVMVLQTWCLDGLLAPCRVTGNSMAPTLLGEHGRLRCVDCGHRYVCDPASRRENARAVCPNCGYTGNELGDAEELGGESVLVCRWAYVWRRPRRWEVVALRHPGRASQIDVKRVVGLPGEHVRIWCGDVYVNGQIQRKTLQQQRAMAILVHDADCQAETGPQRWRGQSASSRWGWTNEGYACPSVDAAQGTDWLVYHHEGRKVGRPGESRESPVMDLCGLDQGRPRRDEDTHVVTDVMLSAHVVRSWGNGSLRLRLTDGQEQFEVWLEPGRPGLQSWHNGREIGEDNVRLLAWRGEGLVEVSLFDQQLLLALDGKTVLRYGYERAERDFAPTSRPLSIGCRGLGVLVRDLQVYRDPYYTRPVGPAFCPGMDQECVLGGEQYYVLGDNSPISEDSRTWVRGPAIEHKSLIGKPLAVVFSPREVRWGGLVFQVPDAERMRYIR